MIIVIALVVAALVTVAVFAAIALTESDPALHPPLAAPDTRSLAEVLADYPERDLHQPLSLHEREALAVAHSHVDDAHFADLLDERPWGAR